MSSALALGLAAQLATAAAPCDEGRCRTVVSIRVPQLLAGGLELQGERYFGGDAWSLAASLGARAQAAGDFGSFRYGGGVEARRWLWRGWASSAEGAPLGGLFAGLRLDAGLGRTWAAEGRVLGQETQLDGSLHLGYRFFPAWRIELTPTLGLGISTRFDHSGRLGPRTRWHQVLGLTVGWAI